MSISQNGYPASPDRDAIDVDRDFTSNGATFPGGVLRGHVSWLFNWLVTQLHTRVEPVHPGWCWGYNYREIRGGGRLSNHASGTAIDYNAPNHGLGGINTFPADDRATIRRILDECDNIIRWGGDYTGRKDEMHFEINAPIDRVIATVERLQGSSSAPPIGSELSKTTIQTIQRIINKWYPKLISLVEDGVWGPKTENAVKYFQEQNGLVPDGIVGPLTRARLGMKD